MVNILRILIFNWFEKFLKFLKVYCELLYKVFKSKEEVSFKERLKTKINCESFFESFRSFVHFICKNFIWNLRLIAKAFLRAFWKIRTITNIFLFLKIFKFTKLFIFMKALCSLKSYKKV
jgi:hypothetical protein